ncbi:hypothetical protein AB0910_12340 [Streptomyces sp. NPDC047002]|uniref:hypothetical protein n=1 Tax=Streptomyces sp. NPDC047002 TaxID=3155475 RepID=UPI0034561D61
MTVPTQVETFESRVPDGWGWRGVPFRLPPVPAGRGGAAAGADGGKHDGGPMPPEAPRTPQPAGGDNGGSR